MGMTPADTPSSPSGYAEVTPHGQGPAAYDIQAPMMDGEITAAFDATNREMGAGFLYPQGPRQAEAERLLDSPQGYADFTILAGTTAGWPADVTPPGTVDNGGYGGA
jgi:hypothetical protein